MTATTLTMASLSATGLLRFASPSLTSTTRFQPLSLSNRFRSPFRPFRSGQNIRFMSSASPSITITPISVGEKLPDATLSYLDSADEVRTVSISDLTKGKKAVLFAVPGAFTPTCSQKHLPGFVQRAGELRAKGVNTIACVSVNDAFVMKAWKEYLKIGDEVLLLSDGNGDFTRALGVELDLRDKPAKLGIRSRRYSLLAEDGVIKLLNMEAGGAFTVSGAEDILKAL